MGGPAGEVSVSSRTRAGEVSLFRLYTLRLSYFILAAGLGVYVWPRVFNHTSEYAAAHGAECALLAGIGATALLGFRYPVRMIPLLLFELIWKTVYLTGFALPLWSSHQITAEVAADIQAVAMVVIFLPLIPWRYVFAEFVLKRGDRWK